MSKYAIWNKKDDILTPVGQVFTAEQWMARYPVAALDTVTVVCGGGEINGAFFGTLGQMVTNCENEGCDFSECITPEEKLLKIEEFEKRETVSEPTAEERIAAALEYQVLASMPDAE